MLLKIIEFVEQYLFKRIYYKRICKSRRPIRNLRFIMKVTGQKIVQLQIALVVLGNPDKAGLDPIPKIDTQNRFYVKFWCLSNKV